MTDNPKPLSAAERFYVEQHATMPLVKLARALGRDAKELAGILPAAQTPFEKKVAPIIRCGKRVGVVWSEAAGAHMDHVLGHQPGSTKQAPQPPMVEGVICTTAGTDEDPHCVHVLRRNGG
jgi:hypothetical protein